MRTAAFLLMYVLLQSVAPAHAPKITEEMIAHYLAEHYDCADADAIRLDDVEYFNFTGHDYDDVIVVASTCQSGTGGPDVHSVFSWVDEGKLGELDFEEVNPKRYQVLFGNRNSVLSPDKDDRELIETFYDTSGRDRPLVLMFQWDGKQDKFLLNAVQSAPMYKTSYDCTKAQKEVDRAICYVEPLAKLDVDLNASYSSLSTRLPVAARKALVQEQREWLALRDRDCVVYKGWVDCLTNMYTARIAELKQAAQHPGTPAPVH
jgi:uncharacterized protein YecT (DUF1311 family)